MELTEPSYTLQYPDAIPVLCYQNIHFRKDQESLPLLHRHPDTELPSHQTFGHLLWQNIPVAPVSFQGGGDQQPLSRCSSVFLRGDQCLPLGSFGSLPEISVLARNMGGILPEGAIGAPV
jgi:hypothetical protein